MGRSASCWSCSNHEEGLNRGAWTPNEDKILSAYITAHGVCRWRSLPKKAGLTRCGKSCRLRWYNYLSPDIKRGNISPEEEDLVIRLHRLLGNRWTLIAGRLPGRTGNEMKNYWNTHLRKRVQPRFQKPLKRRDVPLYSVEEVVHEDISTSQNTPLKPTAVRYFGGEVAEVDIIHPEGLQAGDGHDGINQEGWKEADNHVVDIDTSKSWCQLLLENCMGDSQYDRLQPDNMISTSNMISSSPVPLPFAHSRSIILEENYSSSSCNIFDEEIPHFNDFNSLYFDSQWHQNLVG